MLPSVWQPSSLHKSAVLILFVIVILCILLSNSAIAGVTAFDAVTTVKNPVKLTALTKGRFFSEGGKLVEFHINEKHIGTTLSGGDGYAFLTYTPQSKGLIKIKLKFQKILAKIRYKRFNIITAVSQSTKNDLIELGINPKKIKVIYNGIETDIFKPIRGGQFSLKKGSSYQ